MAWVNCRNCNHRYGAWISACPKCGSTNSNVKGKRLGTGRVKIIGIVIACVLALAFVFIIASGNTGNNNSVTNTASSATTISSNNEAVVATVQSPSATPKVFAIEEFLLFGFPDDGYYKAQLVLIDDKVRAITADGTVSITISDEKNNRLYEKSFQVKDTDFGTYQTMFGASTTALVWTIPTSDVKPGIGQGSANVIFTASDGQVLSKSVGNSIFIPKY